MSTIELAVTQAKGSKDERFNGATVGVEGAAQGMEFFDNPMVDSERLSKLSAVREPDVSPLLQTPEYVSVLWLAGVGMALAYFFVDNSPGSGYKKTIEYIILTIQPFYVVFGSLINSFCPDPNCTSHKAFGLLGLFNIQFITAVRLYAYYETNEGALAPGVLLSLIIWPLFYSVCKNKASKLPRKLNHNVNLINHHNLTMIPIFAVSVLLSLLYMSSESFSCLFDDNHYGMAVTNCQDEINSNETVMMFFAMAVYLKLYTIPHMEEDYSLADVMRLNFTSARDQLLLIFTAIVGIFALFIFSSSTLQWDRVTCTSEFCIDSCSPTKNSTTIKFAIFNEGEAQTRETCVTFCIVSVALVPFLMLLSKKRMKWLRDQIKTTILVYPKERKLSALYPLIFLALLNVGNYLERETELELNKHKNAKLFIAYIPSVVIALKSRVMLSKTTSQVIDNHVQRIFVLGVQVRTPFF
ncbi:hypothetical protein TrLO_g8085 [Triparma laevis f. longispina]|uniref:Uncharacterized protein n=1 Tax=Triparma laevis f. longispina TaxID=1714387 RepID=A0A9W7A5W7_9STRA|nr:hypothetical protein TrLO_g8085 [Triparma laevis f. longispina]